VGGRARGRVSGQPGLPSRVVKRPWRPPPFEVEVEVEVEIEVEVEVDVEVEVEVEVEVDPGGATG
jgi:hypothetical protein